MKGDSIHTFEDGGKESGFFCMKLVSFLTQEKEANQLDTEQFSELWATRFNEAKAGSCSYRDKCPVYEKTLQTSQGVQLNLF
jgi:hypothetical protein